MATYKEEDLKKKKEQLANIWIGLVKMCQTFWEESNESKEAFEIVSKYLA